MTTNNRICSMKKHLEVAGLYFRPAEFVVSIRPIKYIRTKKVDM